MRVFSSAIIALMLLGTPGAVRDARAQASTSSVTQSDIARLQDAVSDLSLEVSRMRSSDPQGADRLQADLDDVRDEVVYLRVKLQKEGSVPRAEYTELRDKIDDLRGRTRGVSRSTDGDLGTSGSSNGSATNSSTSSSTSSGSYDPVPARDRETDRQTRRSSSDSAIPVGQEIDVRLQDSLNSGRNQVEDRFIATTMVDLQVDERVVIPAGSEMRGVVSSVTSAGRVNRKGSLTVTFDEMTINGRSYPIRGTVTQALESEGVKGEAGKIGTGAGVGAIIGGILGGFKGALAGILIGGGGVIAATEGKEVDLPPGTVLRVSLDSPPNLR
jgi:hypothetical protein